jgi:hypothetical protein
MDAAHGDAVAAVSHRLAAVKRCSQRSDSYHCMGISSHRARSELLGRARPEPWQPVQARKVALRIMLPRGRIQVPDLVRSSFPDPPQRRQLSLSHSCITQAAKRSSSCRCASVSQSAKVRRWRIQRAKSLIACGRFSCWPPSRMCHQQRAELAGELIAFVEVAWIEHHLAQVGRTAPEFGGHRSERQACEIGAGCNSRGRAAERRDPIERPLVPGRREFQCRRVDRRADELHQARPCRFAHALPSPLILTPYLPYLPHQKATCARAYVCARLPTCAHAHA